MSFIHDEEKGRLSFATSGNMNELMVDSKVEDPAAVRVGAPAGGALGKISGDRLVVDPDTGEVSRKEKCLVILKEDPTLGGLIEFYTQNPNTEDDANMVRRFSVSSAGISNGDTLISQDRHYKVQLQGDGNLVVTDLHNNQPIWSWMTGAIGAPQQTPTIIASKSVSASPDRGPHIFIDAHEGNDASDGGSWDSPLLTMGEAFKRIKRHSVIHLFGKIQEEGLVTPHGCTGVTVIGCKARPSGRISGEGPKAGGAWWARKNDEAGVPLLRITQQGWRFLDLGFIVNRSGGGLLFVRNLAAEDVTTPDAEAGDHADIIGCRFYGPAPFAIAQEGGVVGIRVEDCLLQQFGKPDQWAILGKGNGVGWPLFWRITDNRFVANRGDINIDGLHDSVIMDNTFHRDSILGSFPGEPSILLGSGKDNVVANNHYAA